MAEVAHIFCKLLREQKIRHKKDVEKDVVTKNVDDQIGAFKTVFVKRD